MKKQIAVLVLIAALIVGGLMAAEPSDPTYNVSWASPENSTRFGSISLANNEWEIDPNETVLPEGFVIEKNGDILSCVVTTTGANVTYARITLVSQTIPGNVSGWTGPKYVSRYTHVIRHITYKESVSPFLAGSNEDKILSASDPNQSPTS